MSEENNMEDLNEAKETYVDAVEELVAKDLMTFVSPRFQPVTYVLKPQRVKEVSGELIEQPGDRIVFTRVGKRGSAVTLDLNVPEEKAKAKFLMNHRDYGRVYFDKAMLFKLPSIQKGLLPDQRPVQPAKSQWVCHCGKEFASELILGCHMDDCKPVGITNLPV